MLLGATPSMPNVHLVVNRLARHLRDDTPLYRALTAYRGRATLHETRSFDDLDAAARAVAASRADAVVLAGGDGSYMAGISALRRHYLHDHDEGAKLPAIGLVAGGTVSTVARNWGMRGSGHAFTSAVLDAATSGRARTTPRPTLHVRDGAGGDRVGFIFGTGLVAQFFDEYYAASTAGYAAAAKIVARIFAGSFTGGRLAKRVLTPMPLHLDVDGVRQPASAYSLVVASVVKDLGLHMHVLHRAAEDPSRVHLVASPLGAARLGPQLPLVLAGKRLLGAGHVDVLARELRVTFTGARDAYVLDGDVLRAREVTVAAGPVLDVITP